MDAASAGELPQLPGLRWCTYPHDLVRRRFLAAFIPNLFFELSVVFRFLKFPEILRIFINLLDFSGFSRHFQNFQNFREFSKIYRKSKFKLFLTFFGLLTLPMSPKVDFLDFFLRFFNETKSDPKRF